MSDIINFPQIAKAFYLEPLALEESTMMACHMYLWPRITGQVNDSAPFVEAKEKEQATGAKYGGSMAHMRRLRAEPLMDYSTWPATMIDPNYFWTVEGKPGVAVIPLNGMIMKGAGPFQESCMGVVNPDRISHALQQAMETPRIKQIVLDIGSPGGRVTYTPELAGQVKGAAKKKTLYAFTDTMIASAAEWLASQANEVIMTNSAQIGSIGTYLAFLNPKVAMQTQGYSLELFSKGTHKGLGLPGRDLSQADREYLQGTVDKLNIEFVDAVKAGRPAVSEEAVRDAKMYDGRDAVAHGLADGLVSSWEEFIGLL